MRRRNIDWSYFFRVFLFVIVAFVGLFVLVSLHELAHVFIFDKYDCSHSVYWTFTGARTIGLCPVGIDAGFDYENSVIDNTAWFFVGVLSIAWGISVFWYFRKRDWV